MVRYWWHFSIDVWYGVVWCGMVPYLQLWADLYFYFLCSVHQMSACWSSLSCMFSVFRLDKCLGPLSMRDQTCGGGGGSGDELATDMVLMVGRCGQITSLSPGSIPQSITLPLITTIRLPPLVSDSQPAACGDDCRCVSVVTELEPGGTLASDTQDCRTLTWLNYFPRDWGESKGDSWL